MPFTASFTISQTIAGSTFTITDISNYGDEAKNTFTARRLYIYLWNGSTYNASGTIDTTPTYIDFSFASYPSDVITIPISRDYAFIVTLSLITSNPISGSTYSATEYVGFLFYLKQFKYQLMQYAAAQRGLFSNVNFFGSTQKLNVDIKGAESAIENSDVWNAQKMIDEGYKLMNNPVNFY